MLASALQMVVTGLERAIETLGGKLDPDRVPDAVHGESQEPQTLNPKTRNPQPHISALSPVLSACRGCTNTYVAGYFAECRVSHHPAWPKVQLVRWTVTYLARRRILTSLCNLGFDCVSLECSDGCFDSLALYVSASYRE